jgi:hypothetical protein
MVAIHVNLLSILCLNANILIKFKKSLTLITVSLKLSYNLITTYRYVGTIYGLV